MDKDKDIIKLLTSHEQEVINNRYLVKYSTMNNGVDKKSYMLVITDLITKGFTVKFCNNTDEVIAILKVLKNS